MLLREPIVSIGNWQSPRPSLTKHKRGIPLSIFYSILVNSGFKIINQKKCFHTITQKITSMVPGMSFNDRKSVLFNEILSNFLVWSKKYHPNNIVEKLRPTNVFFTVANRKNSNSIVYMRQPSLW